MADRIQVGTMLIENGTRMPESLVVSTDPYSKRWSSILRSTSAQLSKEIESAGWTFFYMAEAIQSRGFGFNDQSRMDRAVAHLIKAVELQHCNCLEVTELRRRSFLGVSFTNLTAHPRHIQKSRAFYDASDQTTSARPRPLEPLYNQPAPDRSKPLITGEAAQSWENEGRASPQPVLPT